MHSPPMSPNTDVMDLLHISQTHKMFGVDHFALQTIEEALWFPWPTGYGFPSPSLSDTQRLILTHKALLDITSTLGTKNQ